MSERLVTEADLAEPDVVCECGHTSKFHPGGPGGSAADWHADWLDWAKGEHCPCTKTKNEVRLAHLDSIARREVVKALTDAAVEQERLSTGPRALGSKAVQFKRLIFANWLRERAGVIESGGPS